jgi:hypothetical protein
MADKEEMSRADQIAKRALDLAARAEELGRQAHEVAGVDGQLAALEAELDALAAEEAALDSLDGESVSEEADAPLDDEEPPGGRREFHYSEFAELAEAFGQRIEALGERVGELVSSHLDTAFGVADSGPRRSRWGSTAGDVTMDMAGPRPVRVSTVGGRVAVRAGTAGRILVHWTIGGPFAPGADERPVAVTERDGVVCVEGVGRSTRRGVSLDVEIPPGCPLEVSTGGGGIEISGLGAAIRAKTGGGAITIEAAAGEVVAETGGGSISYAGRPSGQSLIRTGGGSIDVRLAAGTAVEMDARGSVTSIDIDGQKFKSRRITTTIGGGGEGTLTVRTGGGSVRVRGA